MLKIGTLIPKIGFVCVARCVDDRSRCAGRKKRLAYHFLSLVYGVLRGSLRQSEPNRPYPGAPGKTRIVGRMHSFYSVAGASSMGHETTVITSINIIITIIIINNTIANKRC